MSIEVKICTTGNQCPKLWNTDKVARDIKAATSDMHAVKVAVNGCMGQCKTSEELGTGTVTIDGERVTGLTETNVGERVRQTLINNYS